MLKYGAISLLEAINMTETPRALALPNSAVLNMAHGANLPAYIQAVSSIALL